ncbi:hypothetical protein OG730_37320 [Streptomyces sp. NBC_01298]|uniref:hypothetical protein n=1 Tax=Streptomyces sp. NBC_01298 TaxID=2903817 RepID=UPI002E13AC6A|nr:hypothetical protein OG730_37320 [Streptomyces sp. NBC_01298]
MSTKNPQRHHAVPMFQALAMAVYGTDLGFGLTPEQALAPEFTGAARWPDTRRGEQPRQGAAVGDRRTPPETERSPQWPPTVGHTWPRSYWSSVIGLARRAVEIGDPTTFRLRPDAIRPVTDLAS